MTPAPPASFWEPAGAEHVRCTLCPRFCTLGVGQAGFCTTRRNAGGVLVSDGYGTATGFIADPVEKKPLYHFLPGARVLSFGTAGCNLGCRFCQNWAISKARITHTTALRCTAEQVAALAHKERCAAVALTYNDPVIVAEWMNDIARAARPMGIRTIAVTAGWVTDSARAEAFAEVDALNVDLKGFTERFYRKLTLSSLGPVLDCLRWLRRTDKWFEVTTLLIPGHNDDEPTLRAQFQWMLGELGPDVPLHLTAFHPAFRLQDPPRTPLATLRRARDLAREQGLRFVYTGNLRDDDGQSTDCPACGVRLIHRCGNGAEVVGLEGDRCAGCHTAIPGVFGPIPAPSGGRSDYLEFDEGIFS